HLGPVLPSWKEAAVVPEVDLGEVVGCRLRELLRHLCGDAPSTRSALVHVVVVHFDHRRWRIGAEAVGEGREVEVVARGVALKNEPGLDAAHLTQRRDTDTTCRRGHFLDLERSLTDQLTNSRLHPFEATQNEYGSLDSGRYPAIGRLERFENFIKS